MRATSDVGCRSRRARHWTPRPAPVALIYLDALHHRLVERFAGGTVRGATPQEWVPQRLFGAGPLRRSKGSGAERAAGVGGSARHWWAAGGTAARNWRHYNAAQCSSPTSPPQKPAGSTPPQPHTPAQLYLQRVFDQQRRDEFLGLGGQAGELAASQVQFLKADAAGGKGGIDSSAERKGTARTPPFPHTAQHPTTSPDPTAPHLRRVRARSGILGVSRSRKG